MKTRNRSMAHLFRASLLALGVAACGVASAGEAKEAARSIVVRYDDLNVTNPQGAARLYNRIRRAASIVCSIPGASYVDVSRARKQCLAKAIDDAVSSVDSRVLTAMHQQKQPRRFG